ncbi:uncharacterized protein MELLADRAFT_69009 [Melampsora larici-populina 98AG31]|uniref:Uncharacterized protein n=1 Tax=Melampsora larici-populina (strain 98AG31 / pathotype 3-4-7) TaxID=747676 RepID=F4S933_MELLP|nr:uncharacterized protein MELLADRAFT_69009 [Melampsora larici-populina 98AG31]EGF98856.1 hypothetical protein MELLADRAFT_69009 [Melampsora larici-populina 98AG31]
MVNSIRSASTYFSKFFESVNNYTQDIHTEVSSRCASTSPCNSAHPPTYSTTPPPYEDASTPPSYSAAIGGLSMVDRTNRDFKIYERDLKALAIEWSRRKHYGYENRLEELLTCKNFSLLYFNTKLVTTRKAYLPAIAVVYDGLY